MLQFVRFSLCSTILFVVLTGGSADAQTYRGTAQVDLGIYDLYLTPVGTYRFTMPVEVGLKPKLQVGRQVEANPFNFTIGSTSKGDFANFTIMSAVVANTNSGKFLAGSWKTTFNSSTGILSGSLMNSRSKEGLAINQIWEPQEMFKMGWRAVPVPLADQGTTTITAKVQNKRFVAVIRGNSSGGYSPFQIIVDASR